MEMCQGLQIIKVNSEWWMVSITAVIPRLDRGIQLCFVPGFQIKSGMTLIRLILLLLERRTDF